MSAIHGLDVLLRIPVMLDENDCIGACQIEAQTADTGRKQETIDTRV